MTQEEEQKKKDEKTDPSTIDLTHGASAVDIVGATAKGDYLGGGIFVDPTVDITKHGAMYAGIQPLTLATQAGILGVNAIGENLLEMKIKTISDARNFMVGVNNVASVFSENSGLLKSIESASVVSLNHSRLMTETMDRINIPVMTKNIELATAYHLNDRQMVELSESVTTVLAYGQAVQNQFNIITESNIFKNGATVLKNNTVAFGKISDHIPVYAGSEAITSPFVFEPRTVKIKEVEKALPEVKKELPVKTTEAIELMEYVFDPSTKNDDKRITTTVSELKRAIKNMQGSVAMFVQQTASYNIGHIENFAGSIGSITDQSHVSIEQINGFSQEKVIDLVSQIQKFILEVELRTEEKENIKTLAIELKEEISKDVPKQSKIKTALISLKTIFEGAAGNVIAQGIIVELAKLLAGH